MENENVIVKQKSNKKIALIIVAVILLVLVILSIPKKSALKDGGTIIYEAKTWKYWKYHSLGINGYNTGDRLEIFGIKIFDTYTPDTIPYNKDTKSNDSKTDIDDNTMINNADDLYKQFISNIKTRKNAESVSFSNIAGESNGYKHFVLGTDNKLYVETYSDSDTKIPGAIGSGGDYTGNYIGIDNVVRIFKINHTPGEGGSYYGLLVLKEDGNIYIMRNPESKDYKLEKLENKNVVTAYNTITPTSTTYVVDILGNSYEIK